MTMCVAGGHDFPIEDETGGYCEENGIELQRIHVDLSQPPHPLLVGAALEAATMAGRTAPEPRTAPECRLGEHRLCRPGDIYAGGMSVPAVRAPCACPCHTPGCTPPAAP